jgi:uncharacterized protein YlxW (UPF0749 family)
VSIKIKAMITVFFLVYGILIGINLEPGRAADPTESFFGSITEVSSQEVNDLMKANKDMKQKIETLKNDIVALENERAEGSLSLQILMQEVLRYRMLAGHKEVVGPGISITLEGIFEENIAQITFQRKYLITLTNELRSNGAEIISVNGHRITARSEMALAGNHIQVNGRPIAPPYYIQAIGDTEEFKRYVAHRTFIFELMEGDGITADIAYVDEIKIDKPDREKGLQFLQVDRS